MKENSKICADGKCIIPDQIQTSFKCVLKKGIYKRLNQQGLLTNAQLNTLLGAK